MSERIQSISLAKGASITLPVAAFTGTVGRIRSPLPTPQAEITPEDGSIFTVALVDAGLQLTGVEYGQGEITLIAGPNQSQRVTYQVIVEESDTVRWAFSYADVQTTYTQPPEPLGWEVLVNDQRVQLTFTGAPADDPKDIDWGDGTVWSQRDDNPAQYDYVANGTYTISVNGGALSTDVTIDHYPDVVVETSNDPIAVMTHDKGNISTTVDWGDGTTDTELLDTMQHMYAQDGSYTVTVTVGGFPSETFNITIANANVGGASVPPTDTICYGPFNLPGLQQFWVCTSVSNPTWFSVAIDIDEEPGPDIQVFGAQLAEALKGFSQESVNAALTKIVEVWKS